MSNYDKLSRNEIIRLSALDRAIQFTPVIAGTAVNKSVDSLVEKTFSLAEKIETWLKKIEQ